MIALNPRNSDVLLPYLNGEDLNSRADQSASRWVVNFFDWPLYRGASPEVYNGPVAADFPDCLAIVEEKVKPERVTNNRKVYRDRWWQYAEKRPELYRTTAGMERVLAVARTAKYRGFSFVSPQQVLDMNLVIFAIQSWGMFCSLQSTVHEVWVNEHSSTLETRQGYRSSDCFETFPFPQDGDELEGRGQAYYNCRHQIMLTRQGGLTKTYNRFHDPDENAADIQTLRDLHVEMDKAVAIPYGWSDLDLGHGFHETKQGTRFTISELARREVLARLLKLNHERFAEEVAQGLHDKKGKPKATGRKVKKASEDEESLLF